MGSCHQIRSSCERRKNQEFGRDLPFLSPHQGTFCTVSKLTVIVRCKLLCLTSENGMECVHSIDIVIKFLS